ILLSFIDTAAWSGMTDAESEIVDGPVPDPSLPHNRLFSEHYTAPSAARRENAICHTLGPAERCFVAQECEACADLPRRLRAMSAMWRPMASDAVAAGEGALSMCSLCCDSTM